MTTTAHPSRVLVVGGGLAGLRTIAELRAQGFAGELVWVGGEDLPAYDRPPLSKQLLTRPEPLWLSDDLQIDATALADDVVLGRRASSLRRAGGALAVEFDGGASMTADVVVAATGAAALRPFPGTASLHTAADASELRPLLRAGTRLAIIGAGWIGAEVAGVAAAAGCEVTVLEAGPSPLRRQLGPTAGERTRPWYADAGVDLRTGVRVLEVTPGRVLTDAGEVGADAVLAAVGVRPATAWLADSLVLTPTGHVPTDRTGATAVPGLWAVGDLAARRTALFGVVPGGHWFAALRDPALVAAGVLGIEPTSVEPPPEVFSDQLGHSIAVLGLLDAPVEATAEARTVLRETDQGWVELHLHDERLRGAVVVDSPRETSALRKLLGGTALPHLDPTAAADPATPLRRTLRFHR